METELRTVAEQLARTAGILALRGRRSDESLTNDTKSSLTDLVTQFDRAAEATIVAWIRSNRPDDAIVGEEGTSVDGTSGYEWHIDPIDGTTNFVYDLPSWCTSVGVRHRGATVAGAVYVPALDELYSAAKGGGATCNGAQIRVSGTSELGLALVATGFSYDAERRKRQAEIVTGLIGRVRDIRRMGSAAIDLCFVAAGRFDAYFETGLNSWDITAGELIAAEAGAITSDMRGGPAGGDLVVATPHVHAELRQLLEELEADE